MFPMHSEMLYAADNGAGSGGMPAGAGNGTGDQPPGETPGEQPPAPSFETWYAGLDAAGKTLLDGHVQGLKTAVATERQQRADLAKQVKDLSGKAQKGSEIESQLGQLQASLELAERKAAFAEDALRPEIGCVSLKAAWALANQEDLFDRRGRPDWAALKQAAPELFRHSPRLSLCQAAPVVLYCCSATNVRPRGVILNSGWRAERSFVPVAGEKRSDDSLDIFAQ